MKIGFFEIEKWEVEYIKNKLRNHKLLFFEDELNQKNVSKVKDCDIVCVFIYSLINADLLNKFKNLKAIMTMSTGYDHIDISECNKRKIAVYNVPFYGENTVAEHTFALILALSRKIVDSVNRTKGDDFSLKGLRGFDLKNKTIGIMGAGHIGQHVIRMANGFEMNILVNSMHKDKKLAEKLKFKYTTLENLLSNSDIISLHCPLNDSTKKLINMRNVKLIKNGAYLINTARGGLIDTKALIYALDKKILAGAGLDVLEGECDIKEEKQLLHKRFVEQCNWKTLLQNHMLLKNKNVIVTPHNAFNSKEALFRIIDTTLNNINNFNKNKKENLILSSFV